MLSITPAKEEIFDGITIFSALPSAAFSNESSALSCINWSDVNPASFNSLRPAASASLWSLMFAAWPSASSSSSFLRASALSTLDSF